MNTGEQVVDWLYRELLQDNAEWSVKTAHGFIWWADQNAQRVEVVGSEVDKTGDKAWLVSMRTEFLENVNLTAERLVQLNLLVMTHGSMSGPVYDPKARTLSLCSLVRDHEGIRAWMAPLISMAALLQVAEARGPETTKLAADSF